MCKFTYCSKYFWLPKGVQLSKYNVAQRYPRASVGVRGAVDIEHHHYKVFGGGSSRRLFLRSYFNVFYFSFFVLFLRSYFNVFHFLIDYFIHIID